jgi:hypothetical protein
LNLPGRNQVRDLKDDSNDEIVEILLIRKDSYPAFEEDMKLAQVKCGKVAGLVDATKQLSSISSAHVQISCIPVLYRIYIYKPYI